jgi:lipopolysaccharide/colanic/teichoic acid biosynthesis glycosyltransferase
MEQDPAFVYEPPSKQLIEAYPEVFAMEECIKERAAKRVLDVFLSSMALIVTFPIFGLISLLMLLEGALLPRHSGPLLVSYWSMSGGEPFLKWKFRVLSLQCVDQDLASQRSWHAFSGDGLRRNQTCVGRVVKALYFDELPQLFSVFCGKMSLVGPRPLAVHHYQRDLDQGNIHRKILKAGLLGPSQALKGTSRFGSPEPEYEYVSHCMRLSSVRLILLDLSILLRGVLVVFRVRGK